MNFPVTLPSSEALYTVIARFKAWRRRRRRLRMWDWLTPFWQDTIQYLHPEAVPVERRDDYEDEYMRPDADDALEAAFADGHLGDAGPREDPDDC